MADDDATMSVHSGGDGLEDALNLALEALDPLKVGIPATARVESGQLSLLRGGKKADSAVLLHATSLQGGQGGVGSLDLGENRSQPVDTLLGMTHKVASIMELGPDNLTASPQGQVTLPETEVLGIEHLVDSNLAANPPGSLSHTVLADGGTLGPGCPELVGHMTAMLAQTVLQTVEQIAHRVTAGTSHLTIPGIQAHHTLMESL
mmetsp:Transcript_14568/g.34027  ORF Transcript_14568/g.34027 Transcript_14568/m.34027 type:complete len:205 (+) Transcript_14568:478-1092(+)